MSADEFLALKDSIENIGVKNAITIHDGMVLDGWNRYQAAQELGLPCPEVQFPADEDPRDFVLAQNGRARRHLLAAQLIAIAAKVYAYAWKGAGSNQHQAQPADRRIGATELSSEAPISSRELAEKVGVTARSVEQFREVERKAVPEVRDAVERGEIGLAKASAISKLPAEQQADAIKAPMPKPAKHRGKPKKVPAVKLVNAEIKAAQATKEKTEAEDRSHALEEENAALREQLAGAQDDANLLASIVERSDPLAAAVAEAQKQRTLARGLQARIDSMLTEITELTKSVKFWKNKAEKGA